MSDLFQLITHQTECFHTRRIELPFRFFNGFARFQHSRRILFPVQPRNRNRNADIYFADCLGRGIVRCALTFSAGSGNHCRLASSSRNLSASMRLCARRNSGRKAIALVCSFPKKGLRRKDEF